MADLASVKTKVQQILAENFTVQLDSDGEYILDYQSARLYVGVVQKDAEAPVFIRLTCPVLFGVKPTPELFEHIATHSDDFMLGHLGAVRRDDGSVMIFFNHRILGDYLDTDELIRATVAVLATGNDLDDELQKLFGGSRFRET